MTRAAITRRLSVVALVGTLAAIAGPIAPAASAASAVGRSGLAWGFPSFQSTVVASVGFINDTEIGWFSSASRGDSVRQTFGGGPRTAQRALLKIDVVENTLTIGAAVDWDCVINGHVVGSFSVAQGFIGELDLDFTFAKIRGPTYSVSLVVTNDVPDGDGAHTLAYTEPYQHALKLLRRP